MSVLVRVGRHKAILRDGRWISADSHLEQRLNDSTTRWIRDTGGPPISARDQERHVADEMVRRFDGRVLLRMKSRSRRSDDHFFRQRQLSLDFPSYSPVTSRKVSA